MKDIALFLYDLTGNMAKPWIEADYTAVIVDMQHKTGTTQDGPIIRVGADIRNGWMPSREKASNRSRYQPRPTASSTPGAWFSRAAAMETGRNITLIRNWVHSLVLNARALDSFWSASK